MHKATTMKCVPATRHTAAGRTECPLHRTGFFRLASLAFIVYATPLLAVRTHGVIGFFFLMIAAAGLGLLEGSFDRVIHSIRQGVAANKLLIVFAVWYLLGIVLNLMVRGRGLDDWRLMMGPVMLLIGLGVAFGFFYDATCARYFQIGFILVAGVQFALTARQLTGSVGIAREMWAVQGQWEYGTQTAFALSAILFPIFLWRTFVETGMMRVALAITSGFVLVAAVLSTFATPVGLLLLSVPIVIGLSLLLRVGRGGRLRAALIAAMLLAGVWLGIRSTYGSELLAPAYSRIENLLRDPESGGYTGEDARQGSRVYLAQISLNSFRREPLLGMGGGSTRYSPYVGGHSSFLDSLGAYGLLGGGGAFAGFILVVLIGAARRFRQQLDWETLTALTTVILLFVAGVINPYWEGVQPALVLLMARPFLHVNNSPNVPHARGHRRRRAIPELTPAHHTARTEALPRWP